MLILEQINQNTKTEGVHYILSLENPSHQLDPISELETNVNAYDKFITKNEKLLEVNIDKLSELESFGVAEGVECELYYQRDLFNKIRIPFIILELYGIRIAIISHFFKKNKSSNKQRKKQDKQFRNACEELFKSEKYLNEKADSHEKLHEFLKSLS